MNSNVLGDVSICVIVVAGVVGVAISFWKVNGIDNSKATRMPDYTDFWLQQMMPPIAMAFVALAVFFKKAKLRKFIWQEISSRCSVPRCIPLTE